jgi:phosphohistidine swiveling domain-containing protein
VRIPADRTVSHFRPTGCVIHGGKVHGVPDATTHITTGQQITVDGTAGTVTL